RWRSQSSALESWFADSFDQLGGAGEERFDGGAHAGDAGGIEAGVGVEVAQGDPVDAADVVDAVLGRGVGGGGLREAPADAEAGVEDEVAAVDGDLGVGVVAPD